MNTSPDISAGWINGRHRILGRTLAPYSAAHALALTGAGWEGIATLSGILGFLRVCSRPILDSVPKGFPHLPPTCGDVIRACLLCVPRIRAKVEEQIRDYLADFNTAPVVDFPTSQQVVEPFSGNDILALVVRGVQSGIPYGTAWEMPLGALRTWVTHADLLNPDPSLVKGKIRSPEEEAQFLAWERSAANG